VSAAMTTYLSSQGAGRRMLLLLTAALLLPFVLAAVLFFGGWQPPTAPHAGELVAPAAPLSLDELQVLAGPEKSALAERWLLVMRAPAACTAACLARLDALRRLHVALYKAQPRVRRVLLATGVPDVQQPDLTIADAAGWRQLAGADVWLVDPRGYAVLRYDSMTLDASPATRAMLKDIERLLRYSWTG